MKAQFSLCGNDCQAVRHGCDGSCRHNPLRERPGSGEGPGRPAETLGHARRDHRCLPSALFAERVGQLLFAGCVGQLLFAGVLVGSVRGTCWSAFCSRDVLVSSCSRVCWSALFAGCVGRLLFAGVLVASVRGMCWSALDRGTCCRCLFAEGACSASTEPSDNVRETNNFREQSRRSSTSLPQPFGHFALGQLAPVGFFAANGAGRELWGRPMHQDESRLVCRSSCSSRSRATPCVAAARGTARTARCASARAAAGRISCTPPPCAPLSLPDCAR